MVICNIVHDPKIDWDSEDGKVLQKFKLCPAINIITDITHMDTTVPTLFFGNTVAKKAMGAEKITPRNRMINKSHFWSYTNAEVPYECWIDAFVNDSAKKYFQYIPNGIDVVFDEFNTTEFVEHLNKFPLIHEGGYEIYIADWRDREIIIHSIKKDTLEYLGINVKEFLTEIYGLLDYDFLSIEARRFDIEDDNGKMPIFLDDLLFVNSDQWTGIDEIIDYYSVIDIDRPKVITFYLRQSEYLREKFNLYR